jgi:16S rRNA processing protein RimM
MLLVGKVVRPHGLRGLVVVELETDFADDRFAPGAVVWRKGAAGADPVALTVAESRSHGSRWLVGVEGVSSVEGAEALRGTELRIPADAQMVLGPHEYYLHDLIGCDVRTVDGAPVGQVAAVYTGTANALLGVTRDGAEVLVPLIASMCPEIDVAGKRIVVDPPEGLLDVNRPAPRATGARETKR